MLSLRDHTKNDQLLVLLIFMLSTRASGLANSNLLLFSVLIYNILIAVYRRIQIDRSFIIFQALLLIIVVQNYIHLGPYFDPFRYLKLYSIIIISYLTIKIVKFSFFKYFNQLIAYAIIISLPFYAWQLIATDSLHSFGKILNAVLPGMMDNVEYVKENPSLNILVYTIEFVEKFRNSGPMWEPGGFATVIVLAIYFEFLSNGFRFSKRIMLYLLGIATTVSSTGIITLIIVLFICLIGKAQISRHKSMKLAIYLFIPVFILSAFIFFYQSPLLYSKVVYLIESQQYFIENLDKYSDDFLSLGRFGSLQIDMASIKNDLLFGRGYTDSNYKELYPNFNFTNGLSTYVGRLGLIGLAWLVMSNFFSGKVITHYLQNGANIKYTNILGVLVLVIAFSNPVLFTPLYFTLQFFFIPFKLKKVTHEPVYCHSSL